MNPELSQTPTNEFDSRTGYKHPPAPRARPGVAMLVQRPFIIMAGLGPHALVEILLAALAWCAFFLGPGGVAAATTADPAAAASSSSTVTFTIVGAINLNTSEVKVLNLTLWDEYPVSLSDTVYYDVATFLNNALPGTTPTAPAGARRSSGNSTDTGEGSEPMAWYWILLISLGGAIALAAIITAIYFGVQSNLLAHKYTQLPPPVVPQYYLPPDAPPPPPPPPPAGGGVRACTKKVIQIPIMRPAAPPAVAYHDPASSAA